MMREDFEKLVSEALDDIPQQFAEQLDNVEVVVEQWPSPEDLHSVSAQPGTTLFGLYRGVAQTKRIQYQSVLPDKIVIYAGPILAHFGDNPEAVKTQVRKTVLHEIGHHFGMNEEDLRRTQSS